MKLVIDYPYGFHNYSLISSGNNLKLLFSLFVLKSPPFKYTNFVNNAIEEKRKERNYFWVRNLPLASR